MSLSGGKCVSILLSMSNFCVRGTPSESIYYKGVAYFKEKNGKKKHVQELCENRGGRPGLSVLTSLLVSVDVKLY